VRRRQPNLAGRGELQAVGDQVAQDLGQEDRIGDQLRYPRRVDDQDGVGTARDRPQRAGQGGEDVGQPYRFEVWFELARLGLGQVQQLVHQLQQRVGGRVDELEFVVLFLGQRI